VLVPGEVISYLQMCRAEGVSLQRGMNFGSAGSMSVILMSRRPGAPYDDRVEEDGRVLIYEATTRHKSGAARIRRRSTSPSGVSGAHLPKTDCFSKLLHNTGDSGTPAERVRVYEKMRDGIWTFNGTFKLVDGWREESHGRLVFKFRLEVDPDATPVSDPREPRLEQNRLIPDMLAWPVLAAVPWLADRSVSRVIVSADEVMRGVSPLRM
jgi:hypothetical protein